jgi:hypothetical protein
MKRNPRIEIKQANFGNIENDQHSSLLLNETMRAPDRCFGSCDADIIDFWCFSCYQKTRENHFFVALFFWFWQTRPSLRQSKIVPLQVRVLTKLVSPLIFAPVTPIGSQTTKTSDYD